MPFPLFAPTVFIGEPYPRENRVPLAEVDHGPFDALLAKFVDSNGRVAYADWKASDADVRALHEYLTAVGRADIDGPAPHESTLAFWINVYNALTLAGILRVYPTTSIRNHTGRVFGFNIWKNLRLHIGDRTFSLSEIEHGVLRLLSDPRVHFALVCASNSCPVLRPRAFTGDTVQHELEASAREFFARPDAVRIDSEKQVVSLSKLFKWYGPDFTSTSADLLTAIRKFLPDAARDQIDSMQTQVEFLPYDWKLNDQQGE
ncbi:Secreted protein containing DUF547 OS=Rhodopirellula maiorica SM1 GN=RMSM_01751 PE=4 SV=1: DUF547 [Gemmata massiliana]|uniref:DUF547 domain-containing protein n=1 Tax=Gemmata massiliana TaxID=1210884 RepID=A0A6P2CTS4_9BACT|nr:DUF547 domain-containing protein [Gemmata massiliana]VTR91094.1 Secreted protein containing DUF547 OS=Rhodopirellula maiorica SM1 GN=RMSM_01751 PE=4 SV=1: DUF547 [Gemmata massiliana]